MPTVRVAAYVPDARRDEAEAQLQILAAPVDSAGPTVVALSALKAAFGGDYAVVSPWRSWSVATHWHGWLLARGLRVVTPAGPG